MAEDVPNNHRGDQKIAPEVTNRSPLREHIISQILVAAVDVVERFSSSGVFFMIIGALLLRIAYETIGTTHSAMSFVFVATGVAILLFGTGTQGIGKMDTAADPTRAIRYQVALAGGAGVLAFCVAAGMIAFPEQIKKAFLPTPDYIRLIVEGDSPIRGYMERYRYVASVNGTRVPVVQREQEVEILAPYIPTALDRSFHLVLQLQAIDATSSAIRRDTGADYNILIKDRIVSVTESSVAADEVERGQYEFGANDYPEYRIRNKIKITPESIVAGVVAQ